MNEINFVLDKINNMNYLESNICDNKKIKEIVSISFQLYLINELYKDYHIHIIKAKRNINSNGNKRGKVEEVIITNFINKEGF